MELGSAYQVHHYIRVRSLITRQSFRIFYIHEDRRSIFISIPQARGEPVRFWDEFHDACLPACLPACCLPTRLVLFTSTDAAVAAAAVAAAAAAVAAVTEENSITRPYMDWEHWSTTVTALCPVPGDWEEEMGVWTVHQYYSLELYGPK